MHAVTALALTTHVTRATPALTVTLTTAGHVPCVMTAVTGALLQDVTGTVCSDESIQDSANIN